VNNRRKLVIALGASGLAASFGSFAQRPGRVWRMGVLSPRTRPDSLESDPQMGGLLRGLRELGYVEGKNLIIEWRFVDGKYERCPALAAELVQLKADVIVTGGPTATSGAQKATTTIPIVAYNLGDPVASGFAKTLARPGGNITGLSIFAVDIGPKQLEMLLGMVPKVSQVAVLVNPTNVSHAMVLQSIRTAAQKTHVNILPVEARTVPELDQAFSAMVRAKAGAVIVAAGDALVIENPRLIAELAMKHRLPSIASSRAVPEAGGLMSYGSITADNFGRIANYVDKIFKGAKPGDLPVEQPTKFELVINRKTAKALGLTIPQSLLFSVDKVIE
jgi:putative ABC transport system substrate-binding protein